MEEIIADIALAKEWKTVELITEGWSSDKKYYVEDNRGRQYLLRISKGESYKEERLLYDSLKKLNEIDLPVSRLLDSGLCNNGKNTFRLFSWVEGVELQKIIGELSKKEQYDYGYDSGKILSKIHKIESTSNIGSWKELYHQKIDKKIALYQNCGIRFPNAERVLAYIEKHRNLIDGRPQSFHHGDYHVGNMLVSPEKKLGVIDFNRLDFGDPWEEFNRVPWSASKSIWFACGQINGYFDKEVPNEFFTLMALYIFVNQIGSIPWAIPYGAKQVETQLRQTKEVLDWYDNGTQIIPKWYKKMH